jgi:RNA polymerase sigma-70 factor (ECF subfamily)
MDTLATSDSMQSQIFPDAGRSNRELLAAYRRGDSSSAELLVERTYEAVYAAALKLCGDPGRAADLTQETFRKAWQSLHRFEGRSKVSTWLYRIAFTTFLNSTRTDGREVPLDDEVARRMPAAGRSPEETVGATSQAEATRQAVLGLPVELRATVAAHYWGEIPIREIAREAGITPVAVRKRLKKALALLAGALEETRE